MKPMSVTKATSVVAACAAVGDRVDATSLAPDKVDAPCPRSIGRPSRIGFLQLGSVLADRGIAPLGRIVACYFQEHLTKTAAPDAALPPCE
jgi:hypothetical protein